jgi:hypothetical protein
MPHISGLGTVIAESALQNYGISRQRSGFSDFTGVSNFTTIDNLEVGSGLLHTLSIDLTRTWTMLYNARDPLMNESGGAIVKSFFVEKTINSVTYSGIANYAHSDFGLLLGDTKHQHVLLVETTGDLEPESRLNSGINQKWRMRFEFDERERLYSQDAEFERVLLQLNRQRKSRGLPIYESGADINELDNAIEGHPGYTWNGVLYGGQSGTTATLSLTGFHYWGDDFTLNISFIVPDTDGVDQTVIYSISNTFASPTNSQINADANGDFLNETNTHRQENNFLSDIVWLLQYNPDQSNQDLFTATYEYLGDVNNLVNGGDIIINSEYLITDITFVTTPIGDANPVNNAPHGTLSMSTPLIETTDSDTPHIPQWTSYGEMVASSDNTGMVPLTGFENGYVGIPNPMYGWLKVNIATELQLLNDGSISMVENTNINALSHAGGGVYVDGSVFRTPGELVDINFEENVFPYQANDENNNITLKTRNKRKGNGWFKRFPKLGSNNSQGSNPMSYRLTMTERGIGFSIWDDAGTDQDDDYAWFVSQRLVDNYTGLTRRDVLSKSPVHCLYSCSRESLYPVDFGIYYTENAIDSHTIANELTKVYTYANEEITLGSDKFSISHGQNAIILDPYDKEDYMKNEILVKKIWRFVVREYDSFKPWDVHKSATTHQTDSNAIINPMEQLAITDDNRFVITFPTGLTTQNFMYPKEEIDLVCFSSAEVVAEGSTVPMSSYNTGAVTSSAVETGEDHRRYYGLRSTLPNGKGMRVCMLVSGDWIFNTDVNLDEHGT